MTDCNQCRLKCDRQPPGFQDIFSTIRSTWRGVNINSMYYTACTKSQSGLFLLIPSPHDTNTLRKRCNEGLFFVCVHFEKFEAVTDMAKQPTPLKFEIHAFFAVKRTTELVIRVLYQRVQQILQSPILLEFK